MDVLNLFPYLDINTRRLNDRLYVFIPTFFQFIKFYFFSFSHFTCES